MQSKSSLSSDSGNLDLIRALAVTCVFVAHLRENFFQTEWIVTWRFAQMGVIIFFVHTSLVLMLSLERSESRGEKLLVDFYLRRFFRLYPLSMFCVTIAFLLNANPSWSETPPGHWTWWEYASNMALITNLTYGPNMVGGLWTLPLEVQMYAVLPFLFLVARNRAISTLAGVWAVAVIAGYLQPKISGRLNVIEYAPCFIAGVISWRLSLITRRSIPGWLWPAGFIMTWPLFLTATHENEMFFRWAFSLALGVAIPFFQEMNLGPLNRCASAVAKYSYGIYLSHFALQLFAFSRPWPLAAQLTLLVASTLIVPILMYHLIERPMINVGHKVVTLRKSRLGKQLAST